MGNMKCSRAPGASVGMRRGRERFRAEIPEHRSNCFAPLVYAWTLELSDTETTVNLKAANYYNEIKLRERK